MCYDTQVLFSMPSNSLPREQFGTKNASSVVIALKSWTPSLLAMDQIRIFIAKPATAKSGVPMVMDLRVAQDFCKLMHKGIFEIDAKHWDGLAN
jgi:hypothetical protein